MGNNDLADRFVNGAEKGNGSNMFIDGDIIYSYGYHFPIAKRLGSGMYLVNSETYMMGSKQSSSTARQQSHVRNAIPYGAKSISLKNCDVDYIEDQIISDKAEIEMIRGKLARARSDNSKWVHNHNIEQLTANIANLEELKRLGV